MWQGAIAGKSGLLAQLDEAEPDEQAATLMNTAMLITIFISCIGLLGLAMFSAEKRTKEIGIRKVLGASVANIAVMMSKDFVVLVTGAIFIALFTVSFQAIKAALANPVMSLRRE